MAVPKKQKTKKTQPHTPPHPITTMAIDARFQFREFPVNTQDRFFLTAFFYSFNISHYKYFKCMHTVTNSWQQMNI